MVGFFLFFFTSGNAGHHNLKAILGRFSKNGGISIRLKVKVPPSVTSKIFVFHIWHFPRRSEPRINTRKCSVWDLEIQEDTCRCLVQCTRICISVIFLFHSFFFVLQATSGCRYYVAATWSQPSAISLSSCQSACTHTDTYSCAHTRIRMFPCTHISFNISKGFQPLTS